MPRNLGINIQLTIDHPHHPHDDLSVDQVIGALVAVNDAVFRSEAIDLADCRRTFPDWPPIAFDAAAHRIKQFKGSAVRIRSAKSGSLVLIGVVAGLSVWVLQQTIGETMKDSWVETDSHKRLKEFLMKRRIRKVELLAEDARKRLERRLHCEVGIGYNYSPGDQLDEPANIQISVHLRPQEKLPPAREEALPDERGTVSS